MNAVIISILSTNGRDRAAQSTSIDSTFPLKHSWLDLRLFLLKLICIKMEDEYFEQ